jgi:hypothetical protein
MPEVKGTTPAAGRKKESLVLLAAVMIAFAVAFFYVGRYSVLSTGMGKEPRTPVAALDSSAVTGKKAPPVDSAAIAAAKAEHAIPPAGKGHDVRARNLVYNVTALDSSESFTGPDGEIKPTGVFLVVSVKIANTGTTVSIPLPSHVQVVDLDGFAYHVSGKALKICEATGKAFVLCREIAPGKTASGVLVFDVPTLKNSYRLELLDDCAAGRKLAEIYL